jgi:hypothetical protein
LAHSAQAALAYFLKGVFSSTLRTPVETPSLSHVTAMWGPPVSSSPSPRRPTVAASSRHLQPPRAARPPSSGCQARSSLHALIPPLNFPPLTLHQAAPPSMALRPLPPAVSPSPCPDVPLPGHYKRARSTPRPSPHSPRPHLLTPRSATFTPPSASSTDCSPPSPDHV